MTEQTSPDASSPSAAPATPTWVAMAGYTVEKLHTNILASSLENKVPAAKELAAALWKLACAESISPTEIGTIDVKREQRLDKGRHSVVDLVVEFPVGQDRRCLAIEVKVDGRPDGKQLARMAKSYEVGAKKHMVLLCLGGAQACRMEFAPELQRTGFAPRRWSVKDIIELGSLIEAASPAPGVTRDWLAELALEERRRTLAFADVSTRADCPRRGRLQTVYRYGLAAEALAPEAGQWDVSDPRNGVVMTERSKVHQFKAKGKQSYVYLEVSKGALRVKAGSQDEDADPRSAASRLLKPIRAAMEAHDFVVADAKQRDGQHVSLLKLDPSDAKAADTMLEPFLATLRRAYKAWNAIQWPA